MQYMYRKEKEHRSYKTKEKKCSICYRSMISIGDFDKKKVNRWYNEARGATVNSNA